MAESSRGGASRAISPHGRRTSRRKQTGDGSSPRPSAASPVGSSRRSNFPKSRTCGSTARADPEPRLSMPKIDVNKVAEILKKNHIDPALLRRVVEEMNLAVQPDPGEGEKPPAVKKQFVI